MENASSASTPPRQCGSVRVVRRQATFDATEMLERLRGAATLVLVGHEVAVGSVDRLQCFIARGLACTHCGLEASTFALEEVVSDGFEGWTLNLYGDRAGKVVYFTKDHVVPRKRGGADDLANYQTLCWTCNSHKGSRLEEERG